MAALTADDQATEETPAIVAPEGCDLIEAPLGGVVWKMNVKPGDRVARGDVIAVIEAMKTECDVDCPAAGVVQAVYVQEKQPISPGAPLLAIAAD